MKQKDVLKIITYICVVMTMLFIATLAIFYVKHNFRVKDTDNNKHATDFIEQENKKIIDDINKLDSIKYEKTNEVKYLSNDSTLKLFYELMGK